MSDLLRITERYRLDKLIHASDTASVFRATDLRSGKTVALKLFRDQAGEPRQPARERFESAARALQACLHPSLPRLLDHGFAATGSAFLATAYLQGAGFELLAGSPVGRALPLLLPVLDGLEEIDRHHLSHGNLRPDNLLLVTHADQERLVILGWGPAAGGDPAAGDEGRRTDLRGFAEITCAAIGAEILHPSLAVVLPPAAAAEAIADAAELTMLLSLLLQAGSAAPASLYAELRRAFRQAVLGDPGPAAAAPAAATGGAAAGVPGAEMRGAEPVVDLDQTRAVVADVTIAVPRDRLLSRLERFSAGGAAGEGGSPAAIGAPGHEAATEAATRDSAAAPPGSPSPDAGGAELAGARQPRPAAGEAPAAPRAGEIRGDTLPVFVPVFQAASLGPPPPPVAAPEPVTRAPDPAVPQDPGFAAAETALPSAPGGRSPGRQLAAAGADALPTAAPPTGAVVPATALATASGRRSGSPGGRRRWGPAAAAAMAAAVLAALAVVVLAGAAAIARLRQPGSQPHSPPSPSLSPATPGAASAAAPRNLASAPPAPTTPPAATVAPAMPAAPAPPGAGAGATPHLETAARLLAAGDAAGARRELAQITGEQQAAFGPAQRADYDQLAAALLADHRRQVATELAAALRRGDVRRLRAALSAASRETDLPAAARRDLERAHQAVDLDTRLARADLAQAPQEALRNATDLATLLPRYGRAGELREQAAKALEDHADAALAAGDGDRATSLLAGLRQAWPDRPGLAERADRIAAQRGADGQLEAALAAAARAEAAGQPLQGLQALSGLNPAGRFRERFRRQREQLEELLARLDAAPPVIALGPGFKLEYEKGARIVVPLRITDDLAVKSAECWVRLEGAASFQPVPVRHLSGADYEVDIASDLHQNRTVEIYAAASDNSGHRSLLGSRDQPLKLKRRGWLEKIFAGKEKEGGHGGR